MNIFYTHYNRQKYLNTFKRELTLILPAQEIKAVAPFTQIFTQAGLNTNEVCEKFNKLTKIFPAGVLIPTSIFYTPKEKNFEICFRPFQLKLILQQYMELISSEDSDIQTKFQISILNLYKTLLIKSFILNEKNPKKLLRSIFGTLKSYEFPVEINFELDNFQQMFNNNIINEQQISMLIPYLKVETEDYIEEPIEEETDKNKINLNIETVEIKESLEEIDIIDVLLETLKK